MARAWCEEVPFQVSFSSDGRIFREYQTTYFELDGRVEGLRHVVEFQGTDSIVAIGRRLADAIIAATPAGFTPPTGLDIIKPEYAKG